MANNSRLTIVPATSREVNRFSGLPPYRTRRYFFGYEEARVTQSVRLSDWMLLGISSGGEWVSKFVLSKFVAKQRASGLPLGLGVNNPKIINLMEPTRQQIQNIFDECMMERYKVLYIVYTDGYDLSILSEFNHHRIHIEQKHLETILEYIRDNTLFRLSIETEALKSRISTIRFNRFRMGGEWFNDKRQMFLFFKTIDDHSNLRTIGYASNHRKTVQHFDHNFKYAQHETFPTWNKMIDIAVQLVKHKQRAMASFVTTDGWLEPMPIPNILIVVFTNVIFASYKYMADNFVKSLKDKLSQIGANPKLTIITTVNRSDDIPIALIQIRLRNNTTDYAILYDENRLEIDEFSHMVKTLTKFPNGPMYLATELAIEGCANVHRFEDRIGRSLTVTEANDLLTLDDRVFYSALKVRRKFNEAYARLQQQQQHQEANNEINEQELQIYEGMVNLFDL